MNAQCDSVKLMVNVNMNFSMVNRIGGTIMAKSKNNYSFNSN